MHASSQRRAFARSDLLALLAMVAVAAALAVTASRQMRQEATLASSLSQLRWIAGVTASYAADNGERYWNFSWTAGTTPSAFPDLRSASSDLVATGHQGVDIMRRRGRPDMPALTSWIPHVHYSHLPLLDYLDRDMPDFNFVSPGDANRLAWARDPAAFDAGAFLPLQPDPAPFNKRWPYSSSYEQPPAFYDASPFGSRISQATTQAQYFVPSSGMLRASRVADVAHPSQKAHVNDTAQREGAEQLFFLDGADNATVAIAMADASVTTGAASDSNLGWNPNQPTSANPTRFFYSPQPWDPQGTSTVFVLEGRYRWTRGGIAGRDFGGPEIDTGQP